MASVQLRSLALRRAGVRPPDAASDPNRLPDRMTPPAERGAEADAAATEANLALAIRAAREAGLACYRIEIAPEGSVAICVGSPSDPSDLPGSA